MIKCDGKERGKVGILEAKRSNESVAAKQKKTTRRKRGEKTKTTGV